ncbi:MAG: hypothetical protein JW940_38575 [Polyangiaceae bacterium]|nr:hypothetical protein [Polyangiaceae bacterium]
MRCVQERQSTRVVRVDPKTPLLANAEIREAFSDPDDAYVVHAMLRRGWFDG